MKKVVWISLASFALGILAAGYIFVFLPERAATAKSFLDKSSGSGTILFAQSNVVKPDLDFVTVSDKVGPTVVQIESTRVERMAGSGVPQGSPLDEFWNRFFDSPNPRQQDRPQIVQGTGFLISADGFIITNNHLVEKAQKTTVTLRSGENYKARIVGTDPRTDLALIKIEVKDAPFVELGDSGLVKVGEWVLAIGNPLGMEHTVTAGIVSAKGRQLGVGGNLPTHQDFLQTDAAINRGNSGGPLVNLKGEVIGINSIIMAPSGGNIGIGFAIPSNLAKKVVLQLKEKGKVVRGYLGIVPANIDDDIREALKLKDKKGALISSVAADTPAAKAGFKQYDVVIEINGQKVENGNDLRFKIADLMPGTKVEIKVIRDGQVQTLTATMAELEDDAPASTQARTGRDVGIEVTEMTNALAQRYGYRTRDCLVVTDVAQGSDAERKGLEAGDLILEVNRAKVSSVSQWQQIVDKAPAGSPLLLSCRREDGRTSQDFIVTIRVP